MPNYPMFLPPEHLSNRIAKEWSLQEAGEYKDWLLSSLDDRVQFLVSYLDVVDDSDIENFLTEAGIQAVRLLKEDSFSEDGPRGKRLSNLGYALAADMGLLVAKLLVENHGDQIHWNIIRKPKSEMSYNLPVLTGFKGNYLDPIGGSAAEANAILRGERDANTWKNIYVFWCNQIPGRQLK